jgi:hypothetical protein
MDDADSAALEAVEDVLDADLIRDVIADALHDMAAPTTGIVERRQAAQEELGSIEMELPRGCPPLSLLAAVWMRC